MAGRPDRQAIQPDLSESERIKADEHSSLGPHVVHAAVCREGEEELARPPSALAWSALAAGLSMGFSLVGEGLLRAHLPDEPWRPLITKFGYSLGFLIVILGRQQLFTENTLTPILPLLIRRDAATLLRVARLWAVVLAFNLLGALLFAWLVADTAAFHPAVKQAFLEVGQTALAGSFGTGVLRGVFAGWLIALMVWLLPAADAARVRIIILITYTVGLGGLTHVVAGSVEVFYLAIAGAASWTGVIGGYVVPALLGNILGGVALVAALNHAQVVAGRESVRS